VRGAREIDALRSEIRDRYGALPREVEGLLGFAALRLRAEALGVAQVDLVARTLHLRLAPETPLRPEALAALVQAHPFLAPTVQGLRAALAEGEDALTGLAELFDRLEGTLLPHPAGRPDRL